MASRGHFLFAAEEAGVVAHRFVGERFEPRAAAQRRAGLVEGDVPVAADAEDLQVDASFVGDHPLVLLAVGGEVERPAVGHVRVARVDVDVIEEVLLHEVAIAVRVGGTEAHVLVEVEGDDARKIEPFLAVHADQLGIRAQRRAAGGQSEHAGGLLADQFGHELAPPGG